MFNQATLVRSDIKWSVLVTAPTRGHTAAITAHNEYPSVVAADLTVTGGLLSPRAVVAVHSQDIQDLSKSNFLWSIVKYSSNTP